MVRITGRSDEVEPLIEHLGSIIFCMDCEGPYTGYSGGFQCPEHRILQKTGTKSFPLPLSGDRETSQQHDRDGAPDETLLQTLWGALMFHLADNQRVVTGHFRIRQRHVGRRGVGLLVLEGVADQKAIERFLAAVEMLHRVYALKLLNVKIHACDR